MTEWTGVKLMMASPSPATATETPTSSTGSILQWLPDRSDFFPRAGKTTFLSDLTSSSHADWSLSHRIIIIIRTLYISITLINFIVKIFQRKTLRYWCWLISIKFIWTTISRLLLTSASTSITSATLPISTYAPSFSRFQLVLASTQHRPTKSYRTLITPPQSRFSSTSRLYSLSAHTPKPTFQNLRFFGWTYPSEILSIVPCTADFGYCRFRQVAIKNF